MCGDKTTSSAKQITDKAIQIPSTTIIQCIEVALACAHAFYHFSLNSVLAISSDRTCWKQNQTKQEVIVFMRNMLHYNAVYVMIACSLYFVVFLRTHSFYDYMYMFTLQGEIYYSNVIRYQPHRGVSNLYIGWIVTVYRQIIKRSSLFVFKSQASYGNSQCLKKTHTHNDKSRHIN